MLKMAYNFSQFFLTLCIMETLVYKTVQRWRSLYIYFVRIATRIPMIIHF